MKTHINEQLIVDELLFQQYITVHGLQHILHQKYNFKESYSHLFYIARKNHLDNHLKKSASKKRFYNLIQDKELKNLLLTISKYTYKLKDFSKILKEYNYQISNYQLRRILNFFRISYNRYNYTTKLRIPKKEQKQVEDYLKKKQWTFILNYNQLMELYKKFEYDWIYYKITQLGSK